MKLKPKGGGPLVKKRKINNNVTHPRFKIGDIVAYPHMNKRWKQFEIIGAYLNFGDKKWSYMFATWDRSERVLCDESKVMKKLS